ncbi:MAG: DUF2795 domain-containing protein [Bradymonadaceae bacterium]|nr:DUF2795 domain-containing protein [Lujinxingiaceae bacterium]
MEGQQQIPESIINFIRQLDFPADKRDIVHAARKRGFGSETMRALNELPGRSFDDADEVSGHLLQIVAGASDPYEEGLEGIEGHDDPDRHHDSGLQPGLEDRAGIEAQHRAQQIIDAEHLDPEHLGPDSQD